MIRYILIGLLLCGQAISFAQIIYHDASNFPLLGKATETNSARYERFPDSLRNISRSPLWYLSRNSVSTPRSSEVVKSILGRNGHTVS